MNPERKKSREDRSSVTSGINWRLPAPLDPALVESFAKSAGVIPEVASILLRRCGADSAKALSLLHGPSGNEGDIPEPLELPAMREAVVRLVKARDCGEHVVVYSDFDCDGVTGAVVLTEALERAGFPDFEVYFPSRSTESYGFHSGSALALAGKGASLFVTSDCGISGREACEALAALSRDVIVTDHHLPGAVLPRAVAVIDPHLPSWDGLGLEGLSGAGVAYMLSLALCRYLGVEMAKTWAHDLLTLSIAGDGQPVTGPNRRWIRSGLSSMAREARQGILALLRVSGFAAGAAGPSPRRLTFDRDVTYGLVPRINAAGRLSDPRLAYELLRTGDHVRAADLAQELDSLNRQRKEIEDRILQECWEDLPGEADAMCAFRPGWHEGVIGIACSRIREATGRPTVLVGGEGDPLKGSIRGVPGFNVVEALRRCEGFLAAYGGHEAAGGFSIARERVSEFFRAFGAVSGELLEEAGPGEGVGVDEVLDVARVTDGNLSLMLGLEPFGDGNPLPQVACMDCEVVHVGLMGSSLDHMQIVLGRDETTQRFVWFGQGRSARQVALFGRADVLFTPYRSVYRGAEQFSPLVRQMRASWSRSGLEYDGLVDAVSRGRPVILYTWSEHAARSIHAAVLRHGRPAALHVKGWTGAGARDARATLSQGGVVVSTGPWDLDLRGPSPGVTAVHRALDPADRDRLAAFAGGAGVREFSASFGAKDAKKWLSWTHPDKDRLRGLWKFLTRNYGGGRVPVCEIGCRWAEALEACGYPDDGRDPDGGRLFLQSALTVFEQVGLAAYDCGRRFPEFVLRLRGDKVDLEGSMAFALGEEARRQAAMGWYDEVEGA